MTGQVVLLETRQVNLARRQGDRKGVGNKYLDLFLLLLSNLLMVPPRGLTKSEPRARMQPRGVSFPERGAGQKMGLRGQWRRTPVANGLYVCRASLIRSVIYIFICSFLNLKRFFITSSNGADTIKKKKKD